MRPCTCAGAWLALLALAGCGFQLRTYDLSAAFEAVSIEVDTGVDIDIDLTRALDAAGVDVVDEGGDIVVRLSDQSDDWRSVSVTRGARTAEYELAVQVTVSVTDAAGTELAPARTMRSERIARLDRDNLVGSSEERRLLAAEARDDLVGRMLRLLGSLDEQPETTDADPR